MSSGGKVRLGDIAKVNPKASKSASDRDLVSFLPLASVHTNGTTELGTTFERGEVKKGHPYFMCGDILVAKITPSFENGKIAIADCEMADGYSSTEFHVVRPDTSRVDPFYLLAYLRSPKVRTFCSQRMKGSAGQRRVPKEVLSGLTLSLPAMDVQNERAAKLRRIASLIRSENQQIAQLDQLVKSHFVEMFEDDTFPTVKLADLTVSMRNGLSPSKSGCHHAKVLTLSAITQGTFDATAWKEGAFAMEPPADKRVSNDDFYVCRGNGNKQLVGTGDYSPVAINDLVFPDTVIAVKINQDQVIMPFLKYAWARPSVRKQIESSAKTTNGTFKINQTALSSIEVPLPPLALQQDFAAFAAQVDKTRAIAQQQIDKLQTLYDSLAQEYFA